jgi:CheY-like chemotaxis protein
MIRLWMDARGAHLKHGIPIAVGPAHLRCMPPANLLTVLVVDDHAGAREVISQLLIAKGYAVITASSGAEAIEKLKAEADIGAVVTDVSMPDMTGVELTYHVREHYPSLPLAIVSGDIAELERSVIARAGVPFLKKPVRAEALYAAIQDAIAAR